MEERGHDTRQVLGSIPSRAAFCIITVAHFNYIRLKGKDIFYLLYIIRSFLDLKLQFINCIMFYFHLLYFDSVCSKVLLRKW